MFDRKEFLPTHGGTKFDNGVSNVPVVNKNVALSIISVILSLLIVVYGVYNCRNNSFSYSLRCSINDCVYTSQLKSIESISFNKEDLIDASTVRINKDGLEMSEQQVKSEKYNIFGYSVKIKARIPIEKESKIKTEREIILTPVDLGRRKSRSWTNDIGKYLAYSPDSESTDKKRRSKQRSMSEIRLDFNKSVTFLGLMCIVLGIATTIATCYFGQWSEKTRRGRMKKAS